MSPRYELKLLRESLDRADNLASVQDRTITALETALQECRRRNDALQALATNQQQHIQRLESSGMVAP